MSEENEEINNRSPRIGICRKGRQGCQDANCEFEHPRTCNNGNNCTYGAKGKKKCLYWHPGGSLCRNWSTGCTDKKCPHRHPKKQDNKEKDNSVDIDQTKRLLEIIDKRRLVNEQITKLEAELQNLDEQEDEIRQLTLQTENV